MTETSSRGRIGFFTAGAAAVRFGGVAAAAPEAEK
jgi:hypothetical protein